MNHGRPIEGGAAFALARAAREGAIDRALDPGRTGLHKVLARWTGGHGWVDA
ncbi:MAG: hypothetical protein LBQ79_01285 [Deltaproteobacteria bacterium]|nr:hypothetical protein [Deltaproteobacteria bacterium]